MPNQLRHTLKLAELTTENRLLHMLICGKTGMGKSTLLKEIALRDAASGYGFILVDPHGDLASEVLEALPRRRRNDIVHFDAAGPSTCPGLNPLRAVAPADRALVTSNIISTFRRLFDAGLWGPRTEHLLRHVILALLEVRGATLADARDMLVDERRRGVILREVRDPHVRDFWMQEIVGLDKRFQAEITAPLLNKIGAVIGHPLVREIVTKSRPRVDARKLMDRGAIVIASLPRGRLGEDGTALLGGLLLGAFQQAALGRADLRRRDRRPFFILVDELGAFAAAPLLSLIAEARKFSVGLVLATQSIAVLEPPVRTMVLGNAGTLVSFRLGAEDAQIVSDELVHEVEAAHLQRLALHECAVRTGGGRSVVLADRATVAQPSG
jgi:hypothetical protein